MTAVGSDLVMIGWLAAKLAVAPILKAAGHYDQVITGEYAFAGLRRDVNAAPLFDVDAS